MLQPYPELLQAAAAIVLEIEGLFIRQTVHDYIWGYKDNLLAAINNITSNSFIHSNIVQDEWGLYYGVNLCLI